MSRKLGTYHRCGALCFVGNIFALQGMGSRLQGQVSAMMSGIQLNTLVDFHVLTEEQLNGILSQINQA